MAIEISDLLDAKQVIVERWFPRAEAVARLATASRWPCRTVSATRLARQGIHGVGVGHKLVRGRKTRSLSVRVYVFQKLPRHVLSRAHALPKSIEGIPLDVVECLPPRLHAARRAKRQQPVAPQQRRHRPVVAGISVGHRDSTAGTLGYFAHFQENLEGETLILSNNHVLANVNKAKIGDPIYQPGPFDGGRRGDTVARLVDYVRITTDGRTPNRVDAAVAVLRQTDFRRRLLTLGVVSGVAKARLGLQVQKEGRTTGVTAAEIDDLSVDTAVAMDDFDPRKVAVFENQLRIASRGDSGIFSAGGDSGSLIVTRRSKKAVGLLFAGPQDNSYTLANPIQAVLEELQISLL